MYTTETTEQHKRHIASLRYRLSGLELAGYIKDNQALRYINTLWEIERALEEADVAAAKAKASR